MSQLRIVLAMIEPPLPFGNAAARWFYVLLRGLVERGHRVTAFATCAKAQEMEQARTLFPAPDYDLRCYAFPQRDGWMSKLQTLRRPYSYMFGPELRADLERELAKGFDIFHLEQLWSGWLGLKYVDRALVNVHHLVWIDLEHTRPQGFRARLNQRLMFGAERQLVRSFRHFRSCSPRLVPEMLAQNPEAKITTVPVGIDATLYPYIPNDRRSGKPIITLIGSTNWYPTFSAAQRLLTRLWPAIKAAVPDARVQIVGWNARSALKEYLDYPDVSIEENVPETRPYFERAGVMLYAPGRGSGMKIKILEALGYGVPVVTTSEGVEGLPAEDGIHAGVCDDDQGLIKRTIRLLKDVDQQNRQRAAGRTLLEQHCGPKPTLDAIERIYVEMLNGRGSR